MGTQFLTDVDLSSGITGRARTFLRCLFQVGLLGLSTNCAPSPPEKAEHPAPPVQTRSEGERIYREMCASCHEGTVASRAPGYESLTGMSPRAIVASLEKGLMREHGEALEADQRRQVAEWLTGGTLAETSLPASAFCSAEIGWLEPEPRIDWSGWGGDRRGSGYRDALQAGLQAADIPRLRLRWAFGFPDGVQSRSQPALVGKQLIVGSQFGQVFSLHYQLGCVQWTLAADAAVRGAMTVGTGPGGRLTVFFSDFRTNVYAVDAATGELLWRRKVGKDSDSSNTGSVALNGGRLYVPISSMEVTTAMNPGYRCCTSSGGVAALDALTGAELWYHRVITESPREVGYNARGTPVLAPSGAPVWCSPTIDTRRGLLYLGTGQNYTRPATETSDAILALDLETGDRRWLFQATVGDAYNLACVAEDNKENCPEPMGPDVDFGMAPILTARPDGREILVVGQKSGVVFALDPDQAGAVVWSRRVGRGGFLGGIHWGMATDGSRVYVANSDNPQGFAPEIKAERPEAPGIYALDLMTGEVLWENPFPVDTCAGLTGCFAGQSAAPTATPGVVFAGGLDGHLRAYSADKGTLLWDFNTVRSFETANGVVAHGGAIDGPGPVIARGMVFAHSGYGMFDQMPGNVLLAFGVENP